MLKLDERTVTIWLMIGTATAQLLITGAFLMGYFWVMHEFVTGSLKVQSDYREMFAALLGVITGNLGTIMTFWFLRQRGVNSTLATPPNVTNIQAAGDIK